MDTVMRRIAGSAAEHTDAKRMQHAALTARQRLAKDRESVGRAKRKGLLCTFISKTLGGGICFHF